MGGDLLARLLDEATRDVPAPALAGQAWDRARRVRRRRRVLASVSVVAAVVVTATLVPTLANRRSAPPIVATRPPAITWAVDSVPATLVGRTDLPLPTTAPDFGTIQAGPLSVQPVSRAVALYQRFDPENDAEPQPVFVLGDDRRWRRIDGVKLAFTRDAGDNTAVPLRSTTLSPDGRRAAFAQPDSLVVVELSTGRVARHQVPGFNEDVTWLTADSVLIGQEGGASTVAVSTGTVTRLPAAPSRQDVLAGPGDGRSLTELAAGDPLTGLSTLTIRQWRSGVPQQPRAIDPGGVDQLQVTQWYGRGWRAGELALRAGWGRSDGGDGMELIGIVDLGTAKVARLLNLGRNRSKGCCEPLGWLDPTTVLVRTDKEGVISWNALTGQVNAVAGPFDGVISMALG